jgi:hypothetical protein
MNRDAARMRHLAEQRAHERRLAAAVGADDAVHGARAHVEAHVAQDLGVAER